MRLCWLWAQTLGWKYFGTPVAESQSCAEPMFMPTVRIRDGRAQSVPKTDKFGKMGVCKRHESQVMHNILILVLTL